MPADLETIFSTSNDNGLNLEKAIRSVAYLLEWASNLGNDPVDGNLCNGLAVALQKCADQAPRLQPELVLVKQNPLVKQNAQGDLRLNPAYLKELLKRAEAPDSTPKPQIEGKRPATKRKSDAER